MGFSTERRPNRIPRSFLDLNLTVSSKTTKRLFLNKSNRKCNLGSAFQKWSIRGAFKMRESEVDWLWGGGREVKRVKKKPKGWLIEEGRGQKFWDQDWLFWSPNNSYSQSFYKGRSSIFFFNLWTFLTLSGCGESKNICILLDIFVE